jgi:hypothetical protein
MWLWHVIGSGQPTVCCMHAWLAGWPTMGSCICLLWLPALLPLGVQPAAGVACGAGTARHPPRPHLPAPPGLAGPGLLGPLALPLDAGAAPEVRQPGGQVGCSCRKTCALPPCWAISLKKSATHCAPSATDPQASIRGPAMGHLVAGGAGACQPAQPLQALAARGPAPAGLAGQCSVG